MCLLSRQTNPLENFNSLLPPGCPYVAKHRFALNLCQFFYSTLKIKQVKQLIKRLIC